MTITFGEAVGRRHRPREARCGRTLALLALLGILAAQVDAAQWTSRSSLHSAAPFGQILPDKAAHPTAIASTRPPADIALCGFLQCRTEPSTVTERSIGTTVARRVSGAPSPAIALHVDKYLPFWTSLSTP